MALNLYNEQYQVFVPGHIVRVDGGPPSASSRDGLMLSGGQGHPVARPDVIASSISQRSTTTSTSSWGRKAPRPWAIRVSSRTRPSSPRRSACSSARATASNRSGSSRASPGTRLAGPTITKGNYAASWGNTGWDQLNLTDPLVPYLTSPFGHSTRTVSMVTDGMSNTAFFAEIRQGALNDIRGAVWMSVAGAGSFMSRLTPNGRSDFYRRDPSGADQLARPDPLHLRAQHALHRVERPGESLRRSAQPASGRGATCSWETGR